MIERIDPCAGSAFAAWGLVAHMAREGWRQAGPVQHDGALWHVPMERDPASEPEAQPVRPVAEQAAAMGLWRVEGTADVIWAGVIGRPISRAEALT